MSIQFTHLPVTPLRVTSKFGTRNTNINGASKNHMGIDLGRDFNLSETPITSVAKGTVISNYWNNTRGWVLLIDHGEFKTLYQHLKYQSPIKVGSKVSSGKQIGIMGNSSSTLTIAIHLHFELHYGDKILDPYPYLTNIKQEVEDLTKEETIKLIREELINAGTEPSSWAQEAWRWGKENGITDGTNPKGYCTREQLVLMLKRLFHLIKG